LHEGQLFLSKLLKQGGLKKEITAPAKPVTKTADPGKAGLDGSVHISDSEDDMEVVGEQK